FMRDANGGGWQRIAFVPLTVIALYTNIYLGFLLAGLFVVLVLSKRYRSARGYLIQMGITSAFFLPLVLFISSGIGKGLDGAAFDYGTLEGLRRVWQHLLYFGLPTELLPPDQQTSISFVRVWAARLIVIAGAVALLTRRFWPDSRTIVFGTSSLVISGFLILAYFLLGTLYVEIRHAAVLFAPFILFLLAVLSRLAPTGRMRSWYVGAVSVILIFFYSYGFTALYPDFIKRGDWARVAAFVESNEKPGEPVVVFRNYEALAFAQNYDGPNQVLPEERYFDWNYEGDAGTPSMWPKQIEYVISVFPRDAKRVWLVTEETCHKTPACGPLDKFVKENYTVVLQKDFYSERVRLLKKR
ncbi:MAG: hypothetical protein OEQ28_10635, partial [Acidobacteriota bacterium]|nr:hypothetical protein [Acidobacteriota bacterium]